MSDSQKNQEQQIQQQENQFYQFEDEDEENHDQNINQEEIQNEVQQKKLGFFGKMKLKVENVKNNIKNKQQEKKNKKEEIQKLEQQELNNDQQLQLQEAYINNNFENNNDQIVEINVNQCQEHKLSKMQNLKNYINDKYSDSKTKFKEKLKQNKLKAIQRLKKTAAYNQYKQKRRDFSIYWKNKQEEVVLKGLAVLKKKISKKIVDPHLYTPIKNFVHEVFEENWSNIVEEVQFQFRLRQMEPYLQIEDQPQNCFSKFAAWFNYQLYPNDMSIGKKLKNWRYILLQIISVIPYGVQSLYFLIYILCMDKRDEYQLMYFIVNYKKMQFITQGIFLGIYGYVDFQMCVALTTKSEEPMVYEQCLMNGPGANQNVKLMIIIYLTNLVLVWVCCILLPFSVKKGLPKFRALEDMKGKVITQEIDEREELLKKGCCQIFNFNRGGKLKSLMLFDLFAFLLATGLYIFTMYHLQIRDIEQSGMHIYFSKWVYGMLSFPFILFNIPIFLNVLTRSRPTCYDKKGNCVPPKTDVMYIQPYDSYNDDDELDDYIDQLFEVDDDLIDEQIEEINRENQTGAQEIPSSQNKNDNQLSNQN